MAESCLDDLLPADRLPSVAGQVPSQTANEAARDAADGYEENCGVASIAAFTTDRREVTESDTNESADAETGDEAPPGMVRLEHRQSIQLGAAIGRPATRHASIDKDRVGAQARDLGDVQRIAGANTESNAGANAQFRALSCDPRGDNTRECGPKTESQACPHDQPQVNLRPRAARPDPARTS